MHRWRLLYSMDQHGISLSTLYRNVDSRGANVLAVRNENDELFGAFLSEPFKPHAAHYGSGECFLWKAEMATAGDVYSLAIFPWSGRNEYFMLSEGSFLAIGCGDGKFGLWIDQDLERGRTDSCPTFDNQPLCAASDFTCCHLEVWGFQV